MSSNESEIVNSSNADEGATSEVSVSLEVEHVKESAGGGETENYRNSENNNSGVVVQTENKESEIFTGPEIGPTGT